MSDENNQFSDEDNPENEREFSARGVSDWIKRALVNGSSVEPFFSLLAQAEKTRKDVMQTMTRELRGFLNSIEIQDILLKVLSNAKLEVHATIRLVPEKEKKSASSKTAKPKTLRAKTSKKNKKKI